MYTHSYSRAMFLASQLNHGFHKITTLHMFDFAFHLVRLHFSKMPYLGDTSNGWLIMDVYIRTLLIKKKHYKIFKENVAYIESFNNAANKPYKLSVNQFVDLTNEEFRASWNRFKGHECSTKTTSFKYENSTQPKLATRTSVLDFFFFVISYI